MDFNPHYELRGKHALLSPSSSAWLRYSQEKLLNFIVNNEAKKRGTRLHEWACETIKLKKRQEASDALGMYINYAIDNDLTPEQRIQTQAILQKYTTHSISSTVNLPKDIAKEHVEELYRLASKSNLKGLTTYRDGSRSGILLHVDNTYKSKDRPEELPCKVLRFKNERKNWIAFIGIKGGSPYEIFTGKAENVDLPISVEIGEIKKITEQDSNKRYDFIYEDGVIEGISKVSSADYWNYGKLISSMLRHGMPLPFVVDTIQSLTWDNDNINTWKAGMARALKKFIKDGKAQGFTCMDCGSENVVFQEGCLTCKNCGSSKCG